MPELSVGQSATLACLLEVTAPKLGNVHRAADFEDMTFLDFQISAVAIGPAMEHAAQRGVGRTARDAIVATRELVTVNTNLGTVLLLAPLAAADRKHSLQTGVGKVLSSLTPEDARLVYEAIRLAAPGGLGEAPQHDIRTRPPEDLLVAMQAGAHDLVARQYTNNFQEVLGFVVPQLRAGKACGWPIAYTIVYAQLQLMAHYPDSLIARKCGSEVADQASHRAAAVCDQGTPEDERFWKAASELDFWLRSDGHRRNPGTTADLIAAGLFACLLERDRLV